MPLTHPIFHQQFDVKRVIQIPSIGAWSQMGGGTSERGADSATPEARAIFDKQGHMMVFITHNTDFGDAFEQEAADPAGTSTRSRSKAIRRASTFCSTRSRTEFRFYEVLQGSTRFCLVRSRFDKVRCHATLVEPCRTQ